MIDEEFPIGDTSYTHGDRGPRLVTIGADRLLALQRERDLLRDAAMAIVHDPLVAQMLSIRPDWKDGLVAKLQALRDSLSQEERG